MIKNYRESETAGCVASCVRPSAMASSSLIAMMVAVSAPVSAQTVAPNPAPPQSADTQPASPQATAEQPTVNTPSGDSVAEIIVTGTNIVRNGYKAPTPTTVVGVEKLQQLPRPDIADTLSTLPTFRASTSPQTGVGNLNGGFGGVNALNLRGLGVQRTLTLLDGFRSVAATSDGQVDVSAFPQELVSRVDVVTGGASSAYGSDAVTGVVNFVLDKKFTGLKGELSGGVTRYGDDRNWKASLTGGFDFAEGRGHVLLSGEANYRQGVLDSGNRDWVNAGYATIQNPTYTATNGQPQYYKATGANLSVQVPGGIIPSGPLAGITFNPNGSPRNFTYGTVVSPNGFMIGGENNFGLVKNGTIDPRGTRQTAFGRVDYDLTDHINVFAQAQYARSTNTSGLSYYFNNGLTIRAQENPYVPAELAARATALGVTTFPLGLTALDLHNNDTIDKFGADNKRETQRYVVGATGDVDVLGSNWQWNIGYQKGITNTDERIVNNVNAARLTQAVDAVRVTAANVGASGLPIGSIVCRSSLAAPTNGCVPYNPFGLNQNSAGAVNYIVGYSQRQQKLQLDDVKAGFNGEPFSTWAGPVSIAAGVEHRKEQVSGTVDPVSAVAGWFTGNYFPANGSFNVTEGYIEAVIPLAKDVSFARLLELNGAYRLAHYSNFGNAGTWKIGATYEPVEGVRFRTTYSRDLRAPNLGELFGGSTSTGPNMVDPANNGIRYTMPTFNLPNANLGPETAHTFGFGAVVQPSFVPGLSISVDYWSIKLKGGISSLGGQNVVDFCSASRDPAVCGLITRSSTVLPGELVGRVTQINNIPLNLASQKRRGIDFELSYQTSLDGVLGENSGRLEFRGFATRYLEALTDNGFTPAVDALGADPAKWIYNATVSYSRDRLRASLTGYGFSSGTWNNSLVECTSGCPASTTLNPTVADNRRPGAFFLDATVDFELFKDIHFFVSSQNLLDKNPVQSLTPTNAITPANQPGGIPNIDYRWSALGRTYRAGVRFKF